MYRCEGYEILLRKNIEEFLNSSCEKHLRKIGWCRNSLEYIKKLYNSLDEFATDLEKVDIVNLIGLPNYLNICVWNILKEQQRKNNIYLK
ncbi:MAG: hypothetical protein QW197_03150 [Candidatus Aenigmatarchaeota archaeon]